MQQADNFFVNATSFIFQTHFSSQYVFVVQKQSLTSFNFPNLHFQHSCKAAKYTLNTRNVREVNINSGE